MPPRPSSSTVPQPGSRLAPTISSMPFGDIFSTSAPSSVTSGAARLTFCHHRVPGGAQRRFVGEVQHDAAGFGLVRQRRGLRLQHHRITDALGDRGRVVRGAGKIAVGHADAGGGQHLLAEPFGLRALAELGQPLDRLGRRCGARAGQQPAVARIERDGAHHAVRRAAEHRRALLHRLHDVGAERPGVAERDHAPWACPSPPCPC